MAKQQGDVMPDRRRIRAEVIAHQIALAISPQIERLERLEDWACRQREDADKQGMRPRHRLDIYEKIFEALYLAGAEVITDADRAAAGLEFRDAKGLTPTELRILEDRLIAAMLSPTPPLPAKAD
jgi:hypothetical protein